METRSPEQHVDMAAFEAQFTPPSADDIEAQVAAFAAELAAMDGDPDAMFSADDAAFLEANGITGRNMTAAELAVVEENEARARQAVADYFNGRRMLESVMAQDDKESESDD